MGRKITVIEHNSNEKLKKEIKRTHANGRYRLRVQAILLAQEGNSSKIITEQLMIQKKTLFEWVKWYNEKGLEGLDSRYSGKRAEGNPKWDKDIFEALFEKLDKMEEFFSVPKMQSWIEENYGENIPENTIHDRLKKGGYSFKSSRPNPYKGDPNLQASFKKRHHRTTTTTNRKTNSITIC